MKRSSPSRESLRKPQRILFSNGAWWLVDPEHERSLRLDAKFYQCGWKVGCLCRDLGIGKRSFSRLVEDSLGITSKRWLREIRIVAAGHLLREGTKIGAVSLALSFKHVPDFTCEFKKTLRRFAIILHQSGAFSLHRLLISQLDSKKDRSH